MSQIVQKDCGNQKVPIHYTFFLFHEIALLLIFIYFLPHGAIRFLNVCNILFVIGG
jgi:hypothetical protein